MTWRDILQIRVTEGYGLSVDVGPLLYAFLAVASLVLVVYWVKTKVRHPTWSLVDAEVQLGNIGKVRIRPSYENVQIAHKAWVEMVTRKVGLPFEEDQDVISEVYDSWYAVFGEIRNLAKEIPAEKIRESSDTKELVRLLVDALNVGLRTHLTHWQARFRRWYESAVQKNPERSPQEIQREYPQYRELVDDLVKVNKQLVEYVAVLKEIAQGKTSTSGA